MSHKVNISLLGVEAKIVRAEEHIKTLETDITAYLATCGKSFPAHINRKKHTLRVEFEVQKLPPIRLSVIAGDVVHNARTALDHLWGALVLSTGSKFPCIRTADIWKDTRDQILRGVPKGAHAIIEGLQPCAGTDDGTLMGTLNTLSNRDKHKTIHLLATQSKGTRIQIIDKRTRDACQYSPSAPFNTDAYFEITGLPTSLMDHGVDVKVQGRQVIAFKDAPLTDLNTRDTLLACVVLIRDRISPGLRPFIKV